MLHQIFFKEAFLVILKIINVGEWYVFNKCFKFSVKQHPSIAQNWEKIFTLGNAVDWIFTFAMQRPTGLSRAPHVEFWAKITKYDEKIVQNCGLIIYLKLLSDVINPVKQVQFNSLNIFLFLLKFYPKILNQIFPLYVHVCHQDAKGLNWKKNSPRKTNDRRQ